MNDFWHMEQQQRQRKHTLMLEAEQSRLAAAGRPAKKQLRVVAPVMFRVGGVLMAWGARLQAQYQQGERPTAMPSTPVSTTI